MSCRVIRDAHGAPIGFACSRGTMGGKPICDVPHCGRASSYQCDWKLKGAKKGKTCSAHLCPSHATEVADEKHLCPIHARIWDAHPKNPKNPKNDPQEDK